MVASCHVCCVSGCASMTHLCSLGRDFTVTSVTCDITLEGEIGLIGYCKSIQNKDDEPKFFRNAA